MIDKLVPLVNTIRGKPILAVTKTVTLDKYLIRFAPNALDRNYPTKPTIMTKDHLIAFKGQMVPAYRFLDYSDQVKKVQYNQEPLYNVLLAEHSLMEVNNMQCETLHPENDIAQMYISQPQPFNNLLRKGSCEAGWTKNNLFKKGSSEAG